MNIIDLVLDIRMVYCVLSLCNTIHLLFKIMNMFVLCFNLLSILMIPLYLLLNKQAKKNAWQCDKRLRRMNLSNVTFGRDKAPHVLFLQPYQQEPGIGYCLLALVSLYTAT